MAKQLSFFDEPDDESDPIEPVVIQPLLDENSTLEEALAHYVEWLEGSDSSIHTVRAFRSDINLLIKWSDEGTLIGDIGTADLNTFLDWMLNERDRPCSPKTYARRVTTLKNFFGYLRDEDALNRDPSAALIQKNPNSPLPDVLTPSEIERVLEVTQRLRHDDEDPDARPHLLFTLLLQTGIKKSECMALGLEDVRRDEEPPMLWVRYDDPKMRYKERKIALSEEWVETLEEYIHQRQPQGAIFDCTARNLEYVLRDVADLADVERSNLSFETIRWTCSFRDFVSGMDEEALRIKLGLSRVSWNHTGKRLRKLAARFD